MAEHVCDACGEVFGTLSRLRLHERNGCAERETYANLDPDAPDVGLQAAEGLLTCRDCDRENPNADFEETASFAEGDYHLIVEFDCGFCGFGNENRVVMEGVDRDDLENLPAHLQPDDELMTDGGEDLERIDEDENAVSGDTRVRVESGENDTYTLKREKYGLVEFESGAHADDGQGFERYDWHTDETFVLRSETEAEQAASLFEGEGAFDADVLFFRQRTYGDIHHFPDDFPVEILDGLVDRAIERFEANVETYGPGKNWLECNANDLLEEALRNVNQLFLDEGSDGDDADALNYLLFALDAQRHDDLATDGGTAPTTCDLCGSDNETVAAALECCSERLEDDVEMVVDRGPGVTTDLGPNPHAFERQRGDRQ